jgi:hypothetical protein
VGDHPLHGSSPNGSIGVGKRQSFLPPSLPSADGRDLQSMRSHDAQQIRAVHQPGIADGKFHPVIPPTCNASQVPFQVPLQGDSLELGCVSRKHDR